LSSKHAKTNRCVGGRQSLAVPETVSFFAFALATQVAEVERLQVEVEGLSRRAYSASPTAKGQGYIYLYLAIYPASLQQVPDD